MRISVGLLGLAVALGSACGDHSLGADGDTTETGGPLEVEYVHVYAHQQQTCAVLDESRVKCWGRNSHGRLGMGVTEVIGDDEPPGVLPGVEFPTAVVDVAFHGTHGCAVELSGAVHCWGSNLDGILGFAWDDESVGDDETMLDAPALELGAEIVAVATGSMFTCVVDVEGGVRCWGESDRGQTGYGTTETINPVDGEALADLPLVDIGGPVRSISAGRDSVCVVIEGGHAKCWGVDHFGSLGQGSAGLNYFTIGDDDVPADYPAIELPGAPVSTVSVESGLACALHEDGAVTCWGQQSAALGYGSAQAAVGMGYGDDEVPVALGHVDVGGPAQVVEVGYNFGCALLQQGDVRCWGTSPVGQLGLGNFDVVGYPDPPAAFPPIELGGPAVALTAGVDHACAVLESGDVRCWGGGGFGELGYATFENIGDDETPASMPPVLLQ